MNRFPVFFKNLGKVFRAAIIILALTVVVLVALHAAAYDFIRELLLLPRKTMTPTIVTQCFSSLDHPLTRNADLYVKFYRDEKRRCYAQRWSIPKAYYGGVSGGDRGSHSGTLFITVSLPGAIPANFLSEDKQLWATPAYSEVWVKVLLGQSFELLLQGMKSGYQKTPTSHLLYGMRVYDTQIFPTQKFRDVWLFPDANAQLFITYLVTPDQRINEPKPYSICSITSNVDDRVYIKYGIRCREMPQLEKINTELTNLVRSFMINETADTKGNPNERQ